MKAQDYMNIIEYNHHLYPSTWGKCKNDCGNDARGSGLCVQCAENELSKIVGSEASSTFVNDVKKLHRTKCDIQEMIGTI